ncbi:MULTISPECIES: pantoate--beta-alanine ligase [Methylosinus]|uniref:Pantothenate synthetase n=1 Tax=Methylosinus trichosporium (strain ATCC 35070 / NCIMB 11131 / UNIQEM 75 / OB3b) TaxID=595536 RepID=A0A2D2CWY2_METT3|nr:MULTISPECIES: pantoate--beta-alanine ligase [Methylosinus]ATQ67257.1 pantoate--beta-alanine ligase [Methylosinus trichosporium OB3b]OBS52575.1 pantoate--beta-alanine ligase [Methylosinus sp. 3S-1]
MTSSAPSVPLVGSLAELRRRVADWRARGERIGFVPTMGALHDGHLSLVEEARRRAERVVVSVFVNPTQFAANEDFGRYPRMLEADLDRLARVAADLCYAPAVEEMYPPGFSTGVTVGGPAEADLEDRFRPTHFAGVAVVVAKLLNQAEPDIAVFGEKDYQQLLVIRRMARDLDLRAEIVGAPTLREADGLAMSSRNVYLSDEERRVAPALHRALVAAAGRISAGEPIGHVMGEAREEVATAGFAIDYLEARHALTLARIARRQDGPARLLAAARLGATRLIDNIAVEEAR